MNGDEIEFSGLGGGRKDWARLASLIAIQDAKIAASPKLYLERMSKRCVELQMVLERVEDALSGLDELLSDDPGPLRFPSMQEIAMERNARALRILREWHRHTDNRPPIQPEDSQ